MTAANALQDALAAEHAAIFIYGGLGGRTSESQQRALYQAITKTYLAHLGRRNALLELIRAEGEEPVAAKPAYEMSADLSTSALIKQEALRLERACSATYAFVVASTTGKARKFAINALITTATTELDFGGKPRRLPGV